MHHLAEVFVTFPGNRRFAIGFVRVHRWRIARRRCFFYDRDAVVTVRP